MLKKLKVYMNLSSNRAIKRSKGVSISRIARTAVWRLVPVAIISALLFTGPLPMTAFAASDVDIVDIGVVRLADALEAGEITSVEAVQQYLDRIKAYDKEINGKPGLGTIVTLNEDALAQAAELDAERKSGKVRGPLHGIPVLVKDNINTADMPTSHGNQALATYQPLEDATVVKRLKDAGAIILGKTNMAEFAMFWDTVSSVHGRTYNPYDLSKNINGSSGGTGAAVAASLAAIGLGTESCGSITDVSAFTNLVGFRPTVGLGSMAGVDYNPLGDAVGPLALSVQDAAMLLDVIAGTDPKDPWTVEADANKPKSYVDSLSDTSLKGARIGYVVAPFGGYDYIPGSESDATLSVVDEAVADLEAQGATVVKIPLNRSWWNTYAPADASYWATTGHEDYFVRTKAEWPVGLAALTEPFDKINFGDIIAGSPDMEKTAKEWLSWDDKQPRDEKGFAAAVDARKVFAEGVDGIFSEYQLDALAYPTVAAPPATVHEDPAVLIDPEQFGTHCGWANYTGRPVVTVPAGFADDFPVGISLLGSKYADAELLSFAYDLQESTRDRKAPKLTPSLLAGGSSGGYPKPAAALQDIKGHWAEVQIREAFSRGLIKGDPDRKFRPDDPVTRTEFIGLLVRTLQLQKSNSGLNFTDQADIPEWAREDIAAAVHLGIVTGYEDGTFRPNRSITRAEMAVLLGKAAGLAQDGQSGVRFADSDEIPEWASASVLAVTQAQLMNGRSVNRFEPNAALTRAEATVILGRLQGLKSE
ncbi:amidase [Paenibacillus sophorae]|uniref:Amidase n=1 Tax=Paenibacillus sophorae TaxID=1333845 RepID=A0A1H8TGE7_9BACL|nr:amidase family protein [Paenibacillus sophorae]QWU16188.1 S-layer homology domain-containing protein [Paenibacillus sophorae]SEO89972.1 amidase [Paenibacillus sophorae]